LVDGNRRGGVVALPLMAVESFAKAYPDLDLSQILTSRGQRAVDNVVARVCLISAILVTQLARPSDLMRSDALTVLRDALQENTPSAGPYAVPIFIAQGDADPVVPASTTTGFVDGMCAAGTNVRYAIYPGAGHLEVVDDASADVLAWMESARRGSAPASTCAT
jgi:pimeloyl-ACP methyl ester carboxylesterase